MGKPSYIFYKNISWLILKVSDIKVTLIYGTFKDGNYFKLAGFTGRARINNVEVDYIGSAGPAGPAGFSQRIVVKTTTKSLRFFT